MYSVVIETIGLTLAVFKLVFAFQIYSEYPIILGQFLLDMNFGRKVLLEMVVLMFFIT